MNEDIRLQAAVRLAKQGDAKAFEDLYNLTYKYAYFHAKSMLKDENEAWDLVQDTYIAVYQHIGTLKENKYIKAWIGGIVFNLGYRRLRKKTEVLVGEEGEFLFENVENRDKDLSPEEALDSKETIAIVREAIDGLPELQKAAVIAYYFDEKSIAAIANEAMCSVGTIKSRLNYARKALKDCIEQKERRMGVTLHTVTGPVIVLALRNMFVQLKVSEQKAQSILALVEKNVGLLGAAAGTGATSAGTAGTAAGTAGTSAGTAGTSAGTAGTAAGAAGTAAGAAGTAARAGAHILPVLFGSAKMKIATVILTISITGGGIWGVSSVVNSGKKTEAPVETSIQRERETEPAVVEPAEPEPGWVEVENGWKYLEENGTYVSHTWKEIDGELHYFRRNEMMAVGDVYLGRQVFTFNDSGILEKISPADGDTANTTFYDEEIRYYIDENNIHFVGADGRDKIVYSIPQKIFCLSVDRGTIYFMIDQKLCSIKTDGTGYREEASEQHWWTPVSIASQNGRVAFNFTDESEGDADLPLGWIYGLENGRVEAKKGIDLHSSEYEKLQINGDWTYCVNSNLKIYERLNETPYSNVVYRVTGGTVEQVTGEGVEEYFVYGDTIYYMQNGVFKKDSITEATRSEREQKDMVNHNPVEAYNRYVNEVLIDEFGMFNSFHLEYGYGRYEFGIAPVVTGVDSGIISTHIEDMDSDGVPELMVLTAKSCEGYAGTSGLNIDLHTYRITDGAIKYLGESRLCSNLLFADTNRFSVFIKDFGDRKVIGASVEELAFLSSDGVTYEINLYQINQYGKMETLLSKEESASSWYESQEQWVNAIRLQGFEVTANDWAELWNEEFFISSNEPNCKPLITGNIAVNIEPYSSPYEVGDEASYKVFGDIIVHN